MNSDKELMNKTDKTIETQADQPTGNPVIGWIVRFLKGILAGIGAITPGLSGGVLLVVFGIYEPLVRWLANIRNKFVQHLRYFLPVGIGGVIGVIAFSAVIDYAFENFAPSSPGFLLASLPAQFLLC